METQRTGVGSGKRLRRLHSNLPLRGLKLSPADDASDSVSDGVCLKISQKDCHSHVSPVCVTQFYV